ncbi:MAG: efflux RND transporter periplasmic adaptor subunit [Desulfobacteraceae bacterium]|nr:efflux RND transporter periplasmic adaptor subunit [Desulfobacteraceae bacterium]
MKKKKIIGFILLVLIVCGIGVAVYLSVHHKAKKTLRLYGNVDIRQVELAFHATGRVLQLLLQEGDPVKPGQLVAELDPVRYEASVGQAAGELAAQRQILARLLAGSRPEEIEQARARVRAAEAALKDTQATYRRTEALFREQYMSHQKLDNDEKALKSAAANLDVARQELALAIEGPRKEDIAAARARLKADEAALRLAERQLQDTRLYAPSAGVIQSRIIEPGDMAFPETPVYTLALTNPVWVRAYVSEPDLGKIRLGMSADVTTDSYPGKRYKGWVGFISPTAEFTPKSVETTEERTKLVYQVRIYVCNPQNELRLGMPATVVIPLNQTLKKGSPDPGAARIADAGSRPEHAHRCN